MVKLIARMIDGFYKALAMHINGNFKEIKKEAAFFSLIAIF